MNAYLIIIAFGLIIILLFIIGRLIKVKQALEAHVDRKETSGMPAVWGWYLYTSMGIAFVFILWGFCAPYYYTGLSDVQGFKDTGAIGDTIGGLMNPFIALSGVIVTGLAFWMQYEANAQQRKLFLIEQDNSTRQLQHQIDKQEEERKLQQFESQFYEMIRLHRENVSEMKIEGYNFEEDIRRPLKKFETATEGRKVFVTMKTEFEVLLKLFIKHAPLDQQVLTLAYELFFGGFDKFRVKHPSHAVFIIIIQSARYQHQNPSPLNIKTNQERKEIAPGIDMNFNYKPFAGHSSRLGHYFRHLYLTVKSVVNSDVLKTDAERMRYLKLLRAQLSNHEQILIFYNWLSGYGEPWENDEHHFFTKYNMIHNLWYDELEQDPFIQGQVERLRQVASSLGNQDIFEIDQP